VTGKKAEEARPEDEDAKPQEVAHSLNYFTEMCSGSETGSYLRLIYVCITKL